MGAFCCDKPSIIDGMVFFAFQKTADGNGESYGSEVFLMRSRDLLRLHSQGRAEEASWETLPHGERGLQTPRGLLLGEEPHLLQIAGPRLLCFLAKAKAQNILVYTFHVKQHLVLLYCWLLESSEEKLIRYNTYVSDVLCNIR